MIEHASDLSSFIRMVTLFEDSYFYNVEIIFSTEYGNQIDKYILFRKKNLAVFLNRIKVNNMIVNF